MLTLGLIGEIIYTGGGLFGIVTTGIWDKVAWVYLFEMITRILEVNTLIPTLDSIVGRNSSSLYLHHSPTPHRRSGAHLPASGKTVGYIPAHSQHLNDDHGFA